MTGRWWGWWIVALTWACGGGGAEQPATVSGAGTDSASTGSSVDSADGDSVTSTMATGVATSTTAGSEGSSDSTGAPGPAGVLDEPTFDPDDPEHTLHFYDDFANYAAVGELEGEGDANPNRIGGPWTIRGEFTGDLDAADPYTNAASVRISYPQIGSAGFNDGGISVESHRYVNVTGSEETVVIEYAFREIGPNPFLGKYLDYNGGQGSVGRFDFNNGSTWRLGGNGSPDCASDLLCQLYYDAADRPLLPGLPPESAHGGGAPHRYVQLRTDGMFLPGVDPHGNVTYGYRQNRAWGLGSGEFDWMANRDMTGQSTPPTQMPWMVIKERFTKNPPGSEYGAGRIEHWIGGTPGALTKVIEYLGEAGHYDEGVVFVGPADRSLLGPSVNIMWPQGLGSPADSNVLFGYLRVWSHPRQPIAG